MERIPNLYKIRQIMYPEPEIYTLQDMMEENSVEDSPLDDALFQAYRGTDTWTDVDEERRLIEITVDADGVLTVDAIQTHTQQVSNIVQKLGAGRVQFVGIQGGTQMRVGLVYSY